MQYVRPFDDSKAFDTGFPGYRAQFMSVLESALLIHSVIQENGCGPGLHYHHQDQLYFLIDGRMNVQLGEDVRRVEAGSLVFIPAGLPHRNWNDGPGAEHHFEMIVPTPMPGATLAYMVDSIEDVPPERRATQSAYVRHVTAQTLEEVMPGFVMQMLADPGSGFMHGVVNYAEMTPGSGGPGLHVHQFDQYYLVLEGELTVEIVSTSHVAGSGHLVVVPAGVPHRQFNSGVSIERHLVVIAPAPLPDAPWDEGVDLVMNGITHTGPNVLVPSVTS